MSRTPEDIDKVLQAVREVWVKCPDLRLGQLLECATRNDHIANGKGPCLFYLRDEHVIKALEKFDTVYIPKVP
jgi:hypothetical protein